MSSRPIPRPKRPAALDDAVRSGAGLPTHKRPKFDARNPTLAAPDDPEEHDIFLEADEGAVGSRKTRRNVVELEGYESDSSEEGFDATHKQWAAGTERPEKKKKKDAEGDEDMFGGGGEDSDESDADGRDKSKGKEGKGKKTTRFIELDEIEGQDFSSKREFADIIDEEQGYGSELDSEAEAEEAELDPEVGKGGSKLHAPKIDAFNMRSEMEEGKFDDTGNFIRKAAEKDAIHDSWLEGVSRKDMARAREAREKREEERREKMREDDAISSAEVLATLIPELERGESILEALARIGKGAKKKPATKNHWRQKKKNIGDGGEMIIDSKGKEPDDPAEVRRKELVEKITGAADRLLTRGQSEVYDETRESLMRQYKHETGEDWVDPKPMEVEGEGETAAAAAAVEQPAADSKWEYRWTDGREDDKIYGPYSASEMKSWNEHGFFGEGVEFKKVDGIEGWSRLPEFD